MAVPTPVRLRLHPPYYTNGLNMGKEDGFRYEAALTGMLFSTEDQREGMAAFVEKRQAAFKGK